MTPPYRAGTDLWTGPDHSLPALPRRWESGQRLARKLLMRMYHAAAAAAPAANSADGGHEAAAANGLQGDELRVRNALRQKSVSLCPD